jgi:hypothetical protein
MAAGRGGLVATARNALVNFGFQEPWKNSEQSGVNFSNPWKNRLPAFQSLENV